MTLPAFQPLPALRALGELADRMPVIVIDTREQTPLAPTRLPCTRAGLLSGDYSIRGLEYLFAIERKSIADLVGCCKSGTKAAEGERERFERELHRLRGYKFRRLLIVGSLADIEAGAYRSEISPAAVLNSLKAWQVRFDIPVVFRATPEEAAAQVEDWAYYFARELVEETNDLERGTR
jgi:ERCC4-type nuclease